MSGISKVNDRQKLCNRRPVISSVGFTLPFQPSLWDNKYTQSAFNGALKIIDSKLKMKYSDECSTQMINWIEKLFTRLDVNIHRKSIAVLITAAGEKIIYLNFNVTPVVLTGRSLSMLDLVVNIRPEIEFYLFVFTTDNVKLYEYHTRRLSKVYEQNLDLGNCNPCITTGFYRKAVAVLELLNNTHEKPIFVSGNKDHIDVLMNICPFPEIIFELPNHPSLSPVDKPEKMVVEIIDRVNIWQSEFIKGRIAFAQKNKMFTANLKAVLPALRNRSDGLLLIDQLLINVLKKPGKRNLLVEESEELFIEVEKFLERGNRLQITDSGLLEEWGSIVLLRNTTPGYAGTISTIRYKIPLRTGILL